MMDIVVYPANSVTILSRTLRANHLRSPAGNTRCRINKSGDGQPGSRQFFDAYPT
jgi:hypothetical protein